MIVDSRPGGGVVSEVFISHASADDAFVSELCQWLEALGIFVWVASRKLRGGSKLAPEIEQAITEASHFIVVLSPSTVNSPWVRREVSKALEVQQSRDGYRVVPLLLPGISAQALGMWFADEPVAVSVEVGAGGVSVALPALLAALGKRLPTDHLSFQDIDVRPVEELVLTLTDPQIVMGEGKRRAQSMATVAYEPAASGARNVVSRRFVFTAPLGAIEAADVKWYLESYYLWPVGVFRQRAEGIERALPGWGRQLYAAALGDEQAREALGAWQQSADGAECRFSIQVDSDLPAGAAEQDQILAREAATELLSLPWELLHDGRGWLFQGKDAVRVRRRLPNRQRQLKHSTVLPVRILVVSPRPEHNDSGDPIGYIDHRISARPLVEAVENLGDLARLTVLQPATYGALEQALRMGDEGQPFDVVHFDGHGVYDRRLGLGGLCFEDPEGEGTWAERGLDFVDAARLAGLVRKHRIPVMFLEACQSALAEVNPTASVAARLLEQGIDSVVAMSHSVLVDTARRFVEQFYAALARGARVGTAMLAGQQALFADPQRGKILGAGQLRLQDWFVPVLYQEQQDPQLITKIPPRDVQQLQTTRRRLSLGELPEPPAHHFRGRSRELLRLERLLHRQPWAVVWGTGGQGKTTLAVELARWLVRTNRFTRAGFVSLEHHRDPSAVLDALSHQLVGSRYSVAQYPNLEQAHQPLERALADHATIVVVDNCESVLPDPTTLPIAADTGDASVAIFELCQRLLEADPRTRLIFTTREPLPAPFADLGRVCELGALDQTDAIELVSEVMKQNGWTPPSHDAGSTPQEITELVEAVNQHARALVLLAPEIARRGVRTTTDDLRSLMAHLQRRHPGDRENSLYASVELSLRRLPADSRQHVWTLAVAHGGMHIAILSMLTGLELEAARQFTIELIQIGLADDMGDGHLRLDPGLAPYLLGELTTDETEALRSRWAEAMSQLTNRLYSELGKDAQAAHRLTVLELPNLLAMLDWLHTHWPPEHVVTLAARIEGLLADLGRPQALMRATQVREQAVQHLADWSHARHLAEVAQIERLLQRGDFPEAQVAAHQLQTQSLAAGQSAYPQARYDTAYAHFLLGRVLKKSGVAEMALTPLGEAQHRFQRLADTGDTDANRMVFVTFIDTGDCLRNLGRLDSAAQAYEEAIRRASRLGDIRSVAAAKGQLATIRFQQGRHEEALHSYTETRDAFEKLGEPLMVATAWHQIGIVHEETGQFEASEQAYRQALAIKVRENDLPRQADTLHQLGSLYGRMGRLEGAATFYQQAAEDYARSANLAGEGKSRHSLARTYIRLGRYDQARQELRRAIECNKPYGHAAEPWKAWEILEALERATGHAQQAHAARNQAIETYLAYRHAGGNSQSNQSRLFSLVAQAIQGNTQDQAVQQLHDLCEPDDPLWFTALIQQLQSILAGNQDLIRAADDAMDPVNAAELQLLLEAPGRIQK